MCFVLSVVCFLQILIIVFVCMLPPFFVLVFFVWVWGD